MQFTTLRYALCGALLAGLTACGGGSSSGSADPMPMQQYGTLPLMVSDASSDDWATVGVNILSIALIPQGGGSNVTVYTASGSSYVNLEQLDQLGEILGNVSVPVGTYTGAVLTVSGNPGDVLLVSSEDPEAGFAAAASTQISSADIQIQHTQGMSGSLTVPITVNFVSPLTVSTSSSNALDLEFDLSHPAFIIAHVPPGAGTVMWAVNFNGPIVRHHPIADIASLVLRHLYGTVTSIAADGGSLTVTKDYPTLPPVNPETEVTSTQSVNILVDSANGTLFYDVDAGTGPTTIKSFSDVSGLSSGQYLRIQARYQENGTLTATRIWASSQFNSVWVSPEGHVTHVDAANDVIWVSNELGTHVPLAINANTQFYFHGGTTAIGSGPSFLANDTLVRGFKVHASVVDPLAVPLVAQGVDIETAAYSGAISAANSTDFTYTHDYVRMSDDYSLALDYSLAGMDVNGMAVGAFEYWNFAYPTLFDSTIGDFEHATTGPLAAVGITDATWGDPANMVGWSAPFTVLLPVPVGLATVSSTSGLPSDNFAITTVSQATAYTVDFSTESGQATLVYQVGRTNAIVTVSPIDITTAGGLSTFTNALQANGTLVKVYGVPNADGSVQAYVVLYYTGNIMPAS